MTSRYLKKLREKEAIAKAKIKPFKERIKDFVSFYGAMVALVLSLYNLYLSYKPKIHDLDIFVSDVHVKEDKIQYGIAFYNNGDFTEVVANAASILGQQIEGYAAPLPWEQNRCFEPVIVRPKETVYATYLTEYKINDSKLKLFSKQSGVFQVLIDFDILSRERGLVRERFLVGMLKKMDAGIPDFKDKASYEFRTTKQKVNFNAARPRITSGTYPTDKEFTVLNLCERPTKT